MMGLWGLIWALVMLTGCQLGQNLAQEPDMLPTAVLVRQDFSGLVSDAIADNLRAIFDYGQMRGNRADVVAIVGDSISVSSSFLQAVGEGREILGAYSDLAPVIRHYRDGSLNSFTRRGEAAGVGWAAWGVLSPDLARGGCLAGESPLMCEYRQIRPSVALIMFGTNDAGYRSIDQYEGDLVAILDMTISLGIIPILSTPPPRPDTAGMIDGYREVVYRLGEMYRLPIWDYYALMVTLPNGGLAFDGIHPSTPTNGYEGTVIFDERHLGYGYTVRNLSALMMLQVVYEAVIERD